VRIAGIFDIAIDLPQILIFLNINERYMLGIGALLYILKAVKFLKDRGAE
jgi:hypothetical protein